MSWENPIESDTEEAAAGDLGLAAGSAVSQEDAWAVISSYFEEKGLVDDSRSIRINPEAQDAPGQARANTDTIYNISFGQIYLSKPTMTEADGSTSVMFPHEARLRNLTYSAPLYVDVVCQKYQAPASGPANLEDMEPYDQVETPKEFIGMVPIMLRSQYCVLTHKTDKELTELNECVYDQGGYFIINGSEKVLIAQERMSNNHVYCFRKNAASK
jgi:DNA-directed RNA polymerase II subunit RPB2